MHTEDAFGFGYQVNLEGMICVVVSNVVAVYLSLADHLRVGKVGIAQKIYGSSANACFHQTFVSA